ncbi:mechanosensitive ion channel family protein [Nitratireductor sp. CH_MIT9313-5]|jgi:small-conductance mechanosensitive channel|uniref:mechanosensitive ion channel family protein n=1 Tax=Nitratireductor sp. CH_MIT9313-5 TaxID=3107764 RepID=UPI00300BDDFC
MREIKAAASELEWLIEWMPDWMATLVLFALAIIAALMVHQLFMRAAERLVSARSMFWRSMVKRLGWPLRLALILGFLVLATEASPLMSSEARIVQHGLLLGLIALGVIAARIVLHIWITIYLRRFKLDAEDNLLARKHATQSKIFERIANLLLILIGVAAGLMTFEGAAKFGLSLLASAGAASIIVGLALQPLFKNIFAGVQMAVTQPIRIDDAVLIEGEWGKIEEITSTYVVVRIWDLRRLIVPLSYFIEQPFQNWTREEATLIGSVIIYLDYQVPIQALREKAQEVVRASPLWNGDVFVLQVTDFKEFTMEVRILMSARNSGDAFDLRCDVREQIVTFLQKEYPEALPRLRTELRGVAPKEVLQGMRSGAATGADA